MKTIVHVVDIKVPRKTVYEAVTTEKGLSSWWTTKVKAAPAVGGVVHFSFAPGMNPDMQVTALEPGLVSWKCVSGHEPWTDNTFRFELVDNKGATRIRFRQDYAAELDDDSYGVYNYNWAYYLDSLRLDCEDGTGKPFQP